MSELSDAAGFGSRQARRGASMARSKAQERSGCASDEARRRESSMHVAGEARRGAGESEERLDATASALESAKRGKIRRRQPRGTFEDVAICAGLAPEDILVYVERGEGRGNRPPSKASTLAANLAAI